MAAPREHLELVLTVDGPSVTEVELVSERLTHAASVLEGKAAEEALTLVPLLFALCGRAQAEAASEALDQASGRVPSEAERAARELLVAAEAVDQHLQAVLLAWPKAAGLDPDMPRYVALRRAVARLPCALAREGYRLRAGPRPLAPDGPVIAEVLASLTRAVDAVAPEDLEDPLAFADAGNEPSQLVLRFVRDRGLAEVGDGVVSLARALSPDHLRARLDRERAFAARPTDPDGRPVEVGSLAAAAAHPAVAAGRRVAGTGVLTRLVARLVDLRRQLVRVRAAASRLGADPNAEAWAYRSATGRGLGSALTARGPLHHQVTVADGRILGWAAVAPTEWNLHPQGPVQTLIGIPGSRAEDAARWLVLALDPCVPFDVRLRAAGAGD